MAEQISAPKPYYPEIGKNVSPEVALHIRNLYTAINDHDPAIGTLKNQLTSLASAQGYKVSGSSVTKTSSTSSSTSSSSSVTAAQAQSIAAAQVAVNFPTQLQLNLGKVNNQIGTSYTAQQSDYGGIITLSNAAPVAVTLNNGTTTSVNSQWFAAIENLGAGTATLTPVSGTINGAANITLVTNQGAMVFYDGTNWWALTSLTPTAGGVTSLNALTGSLSLTSTGSTVTITPSGSTIDLEVATAGLPVNNPTFTGTLTGPVATIDQNVVTSATPPTVAVLGPAGAGASATIGGNDTMGEIFLTAGTGSTSGIFAHINLHTAYPTASIACITQCFDTTTFGAVRDVQGYQGSTSQIQLDNAAGFTAGHVYSIRYLIFGY